MGVPAALRQREPRRCDVHRSLHSSAGGPEPYHCTATLLKLAKAAGVTPQQSEVQQQARVSVRVRESVFHVDFCLAHGAHTFEVLAERGRNDASLPEELRQGPCSLLCDGKLLSLRQSVSTSLGTRELVLTVNCMESPINAGAGEQCHPGLQRVSACFSGLQVERHEFAGPCFGPAEPRWQVTNEQNVIWKGRSTTAQMLCQAARQGVMLPHLRSGAFRRMDQAMRILFQDKRPKQQYQDGCRPGSTSMGVTISDAIWRALPFGTPQLTSVSHMRLTRQHIMNGTVCHAPRCIS